MLLLEPWELFYNISGIMSLALSPMSQERHLACNWTHHPDTHGIGYLKWMTKVTYVLRSKNPSKTLSTYNLINIQSCNCKIII